ncbi:unnamed protein product [Sphagnum troendelagicum]
MWKALLGTCRIPAPDDYWGISGDSCAGPQNYISEVPLIVLHQLLGAVVALIHMEKLSQLMEILALAKIFCLRIIARMRQMSRYALAV